MNSSFHKYAHKPHTVTASVMESLEARALMREAKFERTSARTDAYAFVASGCVAAIAAVSGLEVVTLVAELSAGVMGAVSSYHHLKAAVLQKQIDRNAERLAVKTKSSGHKARKSVRIPSLNKIRSTSSLAP